MHIEFVEIQNFRKLKSVRVDFSVETTVFVGANNSGKTSAMGALRHFLVDHSRFTTNDLTLSNWSAINLFGKLIESAENDKAVQIPTLQDWWKLVPSLDIWLNVENDQIHYVSHLIPTLDWEGGMVGVRLSFEPKDLGELYKEFASARKAARETVDAARMQRKEGGDYGLSLWPADLCDFLEKRLLSHFEVHAYSLDASKCRSPSLGTAQPQSLTSNVEQIEGDPLKGLIRVRMIDAQRGFSDPEPKTRSNSDSDDDGEPAQKGRLSLQLQSYYKRHIDPSEMPEASDVEALEAIHQANRQFEKKLSEGFKGPFDELQSLGYPGIANPKLAISSQLKATDGLAHSSALKYEVISEWEKDKNAPCLPEQYNGLGYQNLISIVFRLMSFRDDWMKVGKAGKRTVLKIGETLSPQPLHLVLVEEPEAHLHAQVQQVFIRRAYAVLRNHEDLRNNARLRTQLIVSTHSSHIAHECDFAHLRYFRRKPATARGEVPTSSVVNLSEVFGKGKSTERFVTRYLKATHCDLFFADGAILVEGPAERLLVPHFVRQHYKSLCECYVTTLEIGGRHAHRLRPLIEHLGLNTLVITDMDVSEIRNKKLYSAHPARNKSLVTGNSTLRTWVPRQKSFDLLLDLPEPSKLAQIDDYSSVRVAYQCPVTVTLEGNAEPTEALVNTFEDALVLSNLSFFKTLKGRGLIKTFREIIGASTNTDALVSGINEALEKGKKAELALELLLLPDRSELIPPGYIADGLSWLQDQLVRKQLDIIVSEREILTATKKESV